MDDHLGTQDMQTDLVRRILSAAGRRLEGRWEDPAAWRVLCEETVSTWRCRPEVLWAMLAPRFGLAPTVPDSDPGDQVAVWSAAGGRVVWRESNAADDAWATLEAARGDLLAGAGKSPFLDVHNPETTHWIARGIPGGRGPALVLVLGLSRQPAEPPRHDALAADLDHVTDWMAPLLGHRRRLIDLASEVVAARSECETLSRLGELRARLAAVTAHELKTPLTSITAYAEVLEQQISDPGFEHAEEFLRVIRSEADRLLRLVDRLLDSSRRGRGQALAEPVPVATGDLIEEVLRTMAPQALARELQLVGRVPGDLPRVDGDADLIRQVLVNLLGNALKFTPSGGRIVVAAREDASMVRLSVSDNGPGIAPRELRNIFQSFYRTRATSQTEGVGLGLSIVKDIVGLHDGHLDVHSRLGRGSTFGVLLPKQQVHATNETSLVRHQYDPDLQRRLCSHTLRLVAELAAARSVAVLLPAAEQDGLLVAAAMGHGAEAAGLVVPASPSMDLLVRGEATLGAWPGVLPTVLVGDDHAAGAIMVAPLELGKSGGRGLILVRRRLGGGVFGEDDLGLLRVVVEILGNAWSATLVEGVDRRGLDTVVEALSALTGLRRNGVPTADPLALRLLTRMGRRLGLSSYEIRLLQYAGALHDAGMVLLDPDVVLKPENLDMDERDHVDRHPQRGLDLLGPLVEIPELQAIIRHHHERVDGRGYPEGRRGEAIPLGARILAVIDAFFAMIRSRPWREGLPVAPAVAEIQRHAGTQFDERVVISFMGVLLEEGLLSSSVEEGPVGSGPRR